MTSRSLEYDDLYALDLPSDPQLSPDGSRVVFVLTRADRERDGYCSSVWEVGSGGGALRQLTFGPADAAPRWSPDGRELALLRREGEGPAQLWVLPVDGGEARRVSALAGGAGEPVWSPDGSLIAFAAVTELDAAPAGGGVKAPVVIDRLGYKADGVGLVGGRRSHLFVVPAAGGQVPRQLTAGDFSVSRPVWSPDGTQLAYSTSLAQDRDLTLSGEVYLISVDGGATRRITPRGAQFTPQDWAGEELLLTGQRTFHIGHDGLFSVSSAGGDPVQVCAGFDRNVMVGAPGYPGARPRFDGDRIVFCARDRGATHVYAVPVGGGAPDKLVGDDQVVSGLSVVAGRVAYVAASPDSPGEVYGDGGRLTALFATGLPQVELVRPRSREFTAPDGTVVHGWVLRGAVQGRTPLLLDIHGGPHNAWGPAADVLHLYHQTLAAAGWTVLIVNSRGSDGYGEQFYRAVSTRWGTSDEHDYHAAIDTLIAEGLVDPEQVAVTGYSYGGYQTCWLTARSTRFAAAIVAGTLCDLVSAAGTSDGGHITAQTEMGGQPYEEPELLRAHSPLTYVAQVQTPTLLLHGEADDRCPIGQAEQWFAALRTRGVTTQFVRYPGGSHMFILSGPPSHRIDYCRRVAEWADRYAGAQASERRDAGRRALSSRLAGLRSRLDQLMTQHRVPGAVVGVLDRDELHVVASGVTNVDTGVPVTEDTIFQIGSNTKLYTATLVMQLVDAGLVDLDGLVASYVPELRLPEADLLEQITVRHLLTHTSGLTGDHFGPDAGWGDDTIARFVSSLADVEQLHPVGAYWSYCNAGYCLLGRLIENVTGEAFPDALHSRLLAPLGVRTPVIRPNDVVLRSAAVGHLVGEEDQLRVASTYQELPSNMAAGSVPAATAADVLTFLRMHLDEGRAADGRQVLEGASVKLMQQQHVALPVGTGIASAWGLGWQLGELAGERFIGHGGTTIGGVAAIEVLPDRELAVVVLTNAPGGRTLAVTLAAELLVQLADLQPASPPEPEAEPVTIDDLSPYEGRYVHGEGMFTFTAVDGQLVAERQPANPHPEMTTESQRVALTPMREPHHFRVGGAETAFLDPGPDGAMRYFFAGRIFRRA